MEDFPSNNKSETPAKPEATKKVKPVVTGEVKTKKPSVGRKFRETFIGGNAKTAASFTVFEVLIPGAKDALFNAFTNYIEGLFWDQTRSKSRPGASNRFDSPFGHVAYNRPSSSPLRANEPRDRIRRSRGMPGFNELIFTTRREADDVLDNLFNLISQYQIASVSDLYELSGLQADHTALKWGWTELRGAVVRGTPDGYLLILPRPEPIE